MTTERESVKVLSECIDLQIKKSQDYQNPNSNIVQAMHYRRGVSTIHDMIHQKLLRAQSLLEAAEASGEVSANFESLEDTYKDMINYCSFAVAYLRGKLPGQSVDRDIFNSKTVLSNIKDAVNSAQFLTEDVGDRIEQDFNEANSATWLGNGGSLNGAPVSPLDGETGGIVTTELYRTFNRPSTRTIPRSDEYYD